MKKDNAGVTIISLVITIIVLLILATIGGYSGLSTIRSSQMTKFTTEMKIMQLKVNELYDAYNNNRTITISGIEYVGKGQNATESTETKPGIQTIGKELNLAPQDKLNEAITGSGIDITAENGYRYYDKDIIKALEIDGVDGEFFISVEKRTVVSVEGLEYEEQKYYTLDQLPEGLYNVEYDKMDGNLSFDISSEIVNGEGKIHILNISYNQYVNKWQVKYRLKVEEGQKENSWNISQEFTGNEFTIDVPKENIFKDYEIQVIHRNEIVSEIKEAHVLEIGGYVNYDPTKGGTITTTYTSPQGTYHADKSAAIADKSINMIEGNGYAEQTFSVTANTDGWRVFGIDEKTGEILLIAANIVKTVDDQQFYLRGQTGYEWGIKELNDICEIYGHGIGAKSARTINIADINKMTGYAPETAQFNDGTIGEYGNEITYIQNSDNISYQDTMNNLRGTYQGIFRYYDNDNKMWKTLKEGERVTIKNTEYRYDAVETISEDSIEYDILFKNKGGYWIGNTHFAARQNFANGGLFAVWAQLGRVLPGRMFNSDGEPVVANDEYDAEFGVKPIVHLKQDVNISGGAGTTENPYQIK